MIECKCDNCKKEIGENFIEDRTVTLTIGDKVVFKKHLCNRCSDSTFVRKMMDCITGKDTIF